MTIAGTTSSRVLSAAAAIGMLAAIARAQPRYDFILVDSLNANPLAGEAYLWDINDQGMACGQATIDNVIGYPGIVWSVAGGRVRVPVASPASINNSGLLVGIGDVYNIQTAQTFHPLNLPGTYYAPSFGGVNDSGVAVGTISGCTCSDSGGVTYVPYVWDAVNGARSVAVPNARGLSRINNEGVAIGWLNNSTLNDGFVVDLNTGAYTLLNDVFPPTTGTGPTRVFDINDLGRVVGTRYGTGPVSLYGFVYSPATGVQLLPFPGAGYQQYVRPAGINNAGTIVGDISTTQASQRAFVYTPADGIRDLNDGALVAGLPAGYRLYTARKVSEPGWIVGYGHTAAGKITGYVLKPRITGCPADWNGNGTVEPADVAAFVNVWFTSISQGTLAGDFDGNGAIQPADVAAFVGAWLAAVAGGTC